MTPQRTKTKDDLWKELETMSTSHPAAHHAFMALGLGLDREYVLLALAVALCKQNDEQATHLFELMADARPLTFNEIFNQPLGAS
jgi:hypothetical protein